MAFTNNGFFYSFGPMTTLWYEILHLQQLNRLLFHILSTIILTEVKTIPVFFYWRCVPNTEYLSCSCAEERTLIIGFLFVYKIQS